MVGVFLATAELFKAVLLISSATARIGGLLAVTMLIGFAVAIAVRLRRGQSTNCGCFGSLSRGKAGWSSVWRNVFLACFAAIVVVAGNRANLHPSELIGTIADRQITLPLLVLALLAGQFAITWLLFALWRQQGRMLIAIESLGAIGGGANSPNSFEVTHRDGLEEGAVAPDFNLPDPTGHSITRDELLVLGKPLVCLFAESGCGPCAAVLTFINALNAEVRSGFTLAVISADAKVLAGKRRAVVIENDHVLVDQERVALQRFGIGVVPSAIHVDINGRIAAATAVGFHEVVQLIQNVISHQAYAVPDDVGSTIQISNVSHQNT